MKQQEHDELVDTCKKIIADNPEKAEWYKQCKTTLGFFVGQALRRTKGKYPQEIADIFKELLNA